jgi:hypothetical protein
MHMKSALSRLGLTGVVVAAALTTAVATAGSASADRVSGGYYPTLQGCTQAGHNIVEQGGARDWNCAQVTNGGAHQGDWHLILFT